MQQSTFSSKTNVCEGQTIRIIAEEPEIPGIISKRITYDMVIQPLFLLFFRFHRNFRVFLLFFPGVFSQGQAPDTSTANNYFPNVLLDFAAAFAIIVLVDSNREVVGATGHISTLPVPR